MDLTTGLLKSNEVISQADPTGKYITGFNAGQVARSNATKNEKDRWELDNQEKLQKAIAMSVDASNNLVPDLLLKNGHAMGIDQQVLDHAVKFLPAQWESVRKTAQEKNTLSAVNTPMAEQTAASVAGQGDKAASAASQSSSNAVAVPAATTAAPPAQSSTAQPPAPWASRYRQPMLAPMPGDMVVPTTPMGEGSTVDATTPIPVDNDNRNLGESRVTGQYNQDGTPVNPNKSIFQIANEVPAEPMPAVPAEPIVNPIQLANLGSDEQKQIMTGMQQAGLLPAGATVAQAQAAADADMGQIMAQVVPPNKKMFIGQDGQFDVGAYNKALAEYPAKQAKALDDVKSKYGKYYSDMLAQNIAVQGNERAAQANTRQQTEFDQVQAVVEDAHAKGYKGVTPRNVSTFQEVMGLYNALNNTKKELETLKTKGPKLTDDQFNATFSGIITTLKGAEGINSLAADEKFMATMRENKTFGSIARNAKDPKDFFRLASQNAYGRQTRGEQIGVAEELVDAVLAAGQVKGKVDVYKLGNDSGKQDSWANKSAKNLGSKSNPIPYTKGMKAVKGKFYNVPGHGVIEGTD